MIWITFWKKLLKTAINEYFNDSLHLHFSKFLKTDNYFTTGKRHSYVFVCYPYVTLIYSYVPVRIRVSLIWYPYVPVWCFSQDPRLKLLFLKIILKHLKVVATYTWTLTLPWQLRFCFFVIKKDLFLSAILDQLFWIN